MLLNTIFFGDTWEKSFSLKNSIKEIFFTMKLKKVWVQLMSTKGRFYYSKLDVGGYLLRLPYLVSYVTPTYNIPHHSNLANRVN